ncbi:MAG: 4'-phosphopantetheinyl transferase superfamily protein [Lachnospiraceae bacterium]|nr:4'-phosphopantetheinyl transferase superfamily protein [Lachnospiraceae bacterium]
MVRLFYTEVNETGPFSRPQALHKAAHEMLRQCVLSCMTGITGQSPHAVRLELGYGKHGKPYLRSHPAFCVSLSHAGNIALCAISEAEIGADVQDHRDMPPARILRIANRFYAPPERDLLAAVKDPAEQKALFFRLWAAKEAYIKLTGRGISEDLSGFAADPDAMCVRSVPADNGNGQVSGFLSEPFSLPGYSIMLCTEERAPRAEVFYAELDETFTAVTTVPQTQSPGTAPVICGKTP